MKRSLALGVAVLLASCAGSTPETPAERTSKDAKGRRAGILGIRFRELTDSERAQLVVSSGGLRIESLLVGHPAERMGFRAGDALVAFNGEPIPNGDRFIQALWKASKAPTLLVRRDGQNLEVKAGLDELDVEPIVGDPAPDFTLPTADGAEWVTLSHLLGPNPIYVVFGSWT